jgi:hypothetical protein
MSVFHLTSENEEPKLPVYCSELSCASDSAGYNVPLEEGGISNPVALVNIENYNYHISVQNTPQYRIKEYTGQFGCDFKSANQTFSVDLQVQDEAELIIFFYVHKDRIESNSEYQGFVQQIASDKYSLTINVSTNLPTSEDGIFTYMIKTLTPLS